MSAAAPTRLALVAYPAGQRAGESNCYQFDSFTFCARRIAKGSRLRLLFNSSNYITMQKNYNGGGVVADEGGQDAATAHVTLYHDPEYPSYLELPVVTSDAEKPCEAVSANRM